MKGSLHHLPEIGYTVKVVHDIVGVYVSAHEWAGHVDGTPYYERYNSTSDTDLVDQVQIARRTFWMWIKPDGGSHWEWNTDGCMLNLSDLSGVRNLSSVVLKAYELGVEAMGKKAGDE
jgi:hypothetical protein